MKPTFRGLASIGILLALAFSAILFVDLAIFTAFIIALFLVLSGFFWVEVTTRIPRRFFSLAKTLDGKEKVALSATVFPGQQVVEDFYFIKKGRGELILSSKTDFLSLEPSRIRAGESSARIRALFKTPFAGEFRTKELEIVAKDPFGLFQGICAIPVAFEFTVCPKLLDIALTTMKILGRGGIGELPVNSPGIGTEPYEMRQYQSGDDFRQVNWKATARVGELIVTDHAKEIGASYYIVLDAVASNFFDRDRLATTFLQLANSLTMLGAKFGVAVVDGERVLALQPIEQYARSLEFALRAALEFAQLKEPPLENLLAIVPSYVMKNNREALSLQGLAILSRLEEAGKDNMRDSIKEGPFNTIIELVGEHHDEPPVVYYVSGVSNSIHQIIEIGSKLWKIYGSEFVVLNPVAPWVVAQSEGEAAALYERYTRNLEILWKGHIIYRVGEPLKIVQDLISD